MDKCPTNINASDYMEKLDPLIRKRYKEKLKVIGSSDPYCIKGNDANSTEATFLDITYPDVKNSLCPSPYRGHKALQKS